MKFDKVHIPQDNLALSMAECYKKLDQWEKNNSSADITDVMASLYSSELSENIWNALRNYLGYKYDLDLAESRRAATDLTTKDKLAELEEK